MSGLDNSQYISAHELETEQVQGSTDADQHNSQNPKNLQSSSSNSESPQHLSNAARAILPRPQSGNVSFNLGEGQCPLNFTIEDGVSNEEREEEGEEEYDELGETPQNSQVGGSDSATF